MSWLVILTGDLSDLQFLARKADLVAELGSTISLLDAGQVLHYQQGLTLSENGQLYCLTSPDWDALDDGDEVASQAAELLRRWNGVAQLFFVSLPVRIHGLTLKKDGQPQAAPLRFTIRIRPADTADVSEGARQLLRLAAKDLSVRTIVRLVGQGPLTWVDMYRVFEVISDACGGLDGIAGKGWASQAAMRRFKHTANSPSAIGIQARHAVEPTTPPARPMSIGEAQLLVSSLLNAFLNERLGVL